MPRIQQRNFFLTYPQVSNTEEWEEDQTSHYEFILQQTNIEPKYYLMVKEQHDDGGYHYHMIVMLSKKFSTKKMDIFDFKENHPNIQPMRGKIEQARKYLLDNPEKEGDAMIIYEHGEWQTESETKAQLYTKAINESESKEDFMQRMQDLDPKDFIKWTEKYEAFAMRIHAPQPEEYKSPYFEMTCTEREQRIIDNWLRQAQLGEPTNRRRKSLIIKGRSHGGKTVWARSLGKHFHVQGEWNLAEYTADANYAVFDDIVGGLHTNFERWKNWLGAQQHFSATDKYTKKKTINWGKPSIFLTNKTIPREERNIYGAICKQGLDDDDFDWIEHNCVYLELEDSLVYVPKEQPITVHNHNQEDMVVDN